MGTAATIIPNKQHRSVSTRTARAKWAKLIEWGGELGYTEIDLCEKAHIGIGTPRSWSNKTRKCRSGAEDSNGVPLRVPVCGVNPRSWEKVLAIEKVLQGEFAAREIAQPDVPPEVDGLALTAPFAGKAGIVPPPVRILVPDVQEFDAITEAVKPKGADQLATLNTIIDLAVEELDQEHLKLLLHRVLNIVSAGGADVS